MTQWGLDTLFNPAKRHMDEEKRRLLSTREELGDSSGGKRIDLESGRVRIERPDAEDATEATTEDATADASEDAGNAAAGSASQASERAGAGARRGATGRGAKGSRDTGEPSEAAKRAARRRGRSI